MSAEKPPTLRQQIDSLSADVRSLVDARQAQAVNKAAPPPMTEARALDVCMTALADLRDRESSRSRDSYGMSSMSNGYGSSTDRILRHLAARFGVSLIEVRHEPCDLAHVDHGAIQDLAGVVQRLSNGVFS